MGFKTEDESALFIGLWAAVTALLVGVIFALLGKHLIGLSLEARLDVLLYVSAGTFVLQYFNVRVRDWLINAAGMLFFGLLLIGGLARFSAGTVDYFSVSNVWGFGRFQPPRSRRIGIAERLVIGRANGRR